MPRQGSAVLQEQTRQFILENPVLLTLQRNARVEDGAGGYTTTPADLPEQLMRMVPQARTVSVSRRTVSGEMVTPDMNLICEWDADVLPGDTFQYQGLRMEVVWVHVNVYEKTAEVAVV